MARRRLAKDRAAERDLIDIWIYSYGEWGEVQADRYLAALARGIEEIAVEPERGQCRSDLRDGYRSRRIEHHIVFYTFTASELRVRRVLHEAMDVGRHV